MTTKDYVDYIWHYKVEDNMDWDFCSRILKQDGIAEISAEEKNKVSHRGRALELIKEIL